MWPVATIQGIHFQRGQEFPCICYQVILFLLINGSCQLCYKVKMYKHSGRLLNFIDEDTSWPQSYSYLLLKILATFLLWFSGSHCQVHHRAWGVCRDVRGVTRGRVCWRTRAATTRPAHAGYGQPGGRGPPGCRQRQQVPWLTNRRLCPGETVMRYVGCIDSREGMNEGWQLNWNDHGRLTWKPLVDASKYSVCDIVEYQ